MARRGTFGEKQPAAQAEVTRLCQQQFHRHGAQEPHFPLDLGGDRVQVVLRLVERYTSLMARALAVLALASVLAGAAGCGSQPHPPSIRIRERPSIRILDWSVVGSAVILKVKITGWKMAPPRRGLRPKAHTGQWQIFAGDLYAGYSYNRSYGTINGIAAGTYKIWVALARTDYSLVYPLIRSRPVTVHVGDDSLLLNG